MRPGGRFNNLSGQPVPICDYPQSIFLFLILNSIFPCYNTYLMALILLRCITRKTMLTSNSAINTGTNLSTVSRGVSLCCVTKSRQIPCCVGPSKRMTHTQKSLVKQRWRNLLNLTSKWGNKLNHHELLKSTQLPLRFQLLSPYRGSLCSFMLHISVVHFLPYSD